MCRFILKRKCKKEGKNLPQLQREAIKNYFSSSRKGNRRDAIRFLNPGRQAVMWWAAIICPPSPAWNKVN